MECVFCKIVNKEINADIVFEDEKVLAFRDINPQAPTHILVIPKKHVFEIEDLIKNTDLISYMFDVIYKIAKDLNLDKDGFRVITNYGKGAGQTVSHLHFHLLSGNLSEKIV